MTTGQSDGEGAHEWGQAVPVSSGSPKPGDIITESDFAIVPEPLVGHDVSTPLDEDEPEHTIPPGPLWAMKERRHIQWHLLPAHERHQRIRECLEADDYTLYCIDDGGHHAMIARRVGVAPSGCEYSLIGRISRQRYEELRDEVVPLVNCFDTANRDTTVRGRHRRGHSFLEHHRCRQLRQRRRRPRGIPARHPVPPLQPGASDHCLLRR